jgi:hypothetical protein
LQLGKPQKTVENQKQSVIFIPQNIDLAAKTPQKRPIFSVSTKTWRADLSPRHCGIGNYVDSWKPRFWAKFRPVYQSQRNSSKSGLTALAGIGSSCDSLSMTTTVDQMRDYALTASNAA